MVDTHALTDTQWKLISPLFPKQIFKKGGRPRTSDRDTVNGILWVLLSGKTWNSLPKQYGSAMTCWRRYQELQTKGVWKLIWKRYITTVNPSVSQKWIDTFTSGLLTPCK